MSYENFGRAATEDGLELLLEQFTKGFAQPVDDVVGMLDTGGYCGRTHPDARTRSWPVTALFAGYASAPSEVRIPLKMTTDSTDRDRYTHRSVTGVGFLR